MAPKTSVEPAPAPSSFTTSFFASPYLVYAAAVVLRVVLLLYGLWQDANSPLKYTDIDYLVFTDAARLVSRGHSPYGRETYRYTPLLAWMLTPTTTWFFSAGKVLFAAADVLAGWLLVRILMSHKLGGGGGGGGGRSGGEGGMDATAARKYASIWLLNPMVATISTRGSSEGLLGALVAALLWAVLQRRVGLAGFLLGFAVHFKIYPFIYAPAILWWMDEDRLGGRVKSRREKRDKTDQAVQKDVVWDFITPARVRLTVVSLATFMALNAAMYSLYGTPFLKHTFFHHVSRLDHRHNFSPYNTQLYLASSQPRGYLFFLPSIESLAFLPQLLLSTLLLPFVMAKKDLPTTMLAQTFAFVTFNKVCTSQYFLWYLILLPLYLPRSSFLRSKPLGIAALGLWVGTQALWLQQGYGLEFLGESTFVPGLWLASLGFFLVNCWILGVMISDVAIEAVS